MSIMNSVTIANYGSVPLTVTYGSLPPVNVAVNSPTPAVIGYTGGNITISDGTNNVTMLESGIKSIQHTTVKVNVVDSITVGTPVSASTTSAGPITNSSFTHVWSLIVSFNDKIVIENLSQNELTLGVYSNYFSGSGGITAVVKHHWWILILILLVVVVAIVGGVYYYKKKKRGGM